MVDQSRQQQTLFLRAVRRHVSEAIEARVFRSSSEFTSEVLRTYPNCTLSQLEIERAVVDAAAAPVFRCRQRALRKGGRGRRLIRRSTRIPPVPATARKVSLHRPG
jgi:hypothetical protein